jgi:uncharacterized membrane protein YwaF
MITSSDLILFAHAGFGVLGCLAAVWVVVEILNASPSNAARTHRASLGVTICMLAAWLFGGYWYLHFYPSEKAVILKGPWPFAHNIFMETKEHLFFVTAILALLLPMVTATRERLFVNRPSRKLALAVAAMIAITGLAVEGAGAVINHGAKIAYLRAK